MPLVHTVGHGNRTIEEFLAVLTAAGVTCLVDVRSYPRSRRYPYFGYGPLGASLAAASIAYEWRGRTLGGRRRSDAETNHPGLSEPSFRAYAEHMRGEAFQRAAARVLAAAAQEVLCLMCAERDPGRCHRSLIADWMTVRGATVVHLIETGQSREHAPHPAMRVEDGLLRYSRGAAQGELF